MSLSIEEITLSQQILRAIDETKSLMSKGGASTWAADMIEGRDNLFTRVKAMKQRHLRTYLAMIKDQGQLSPKIKRYYAEALRSYHYGVGNCHQQSLLLAFYLWQNPGQIQRIEVIQGATFDHVLVIVNRPFDSKLNHWPSWGEQTWLIDPLAKTYSRSNNMDAFWQGVINTAFRQTAQMAAAGLRQPWCPDRRSAKDIKLNLNSLFALYPQSQTFPRCLTRLTVKTTQAPTMAKTLQADIGSFQFWKKDNEAPKSLISSPNHDQRSSGAMNASLTVPKAELIDAILSDDLTRLTALSPMQWVESIAQLSWHSPLSDDKVTFTQVPAFLAANAGYKKSFDLLWQQLPLGTQIESLYAKPSIIEAAICGGNASICQVLLECLKKHIGLEGISHPDIDSWVWLAAYFNAPEILQDLITNLAPRLDYQHEKISPLWLACHRGYASCVAVLLQVENRERVDINHCRMVGLLTGQSGYAGEIAVLQGLYDIAEQVILGAGDLMDMEQIKDLWDLAIGRGHASLLNCLLQHPKIDCNPLINKPYYLFEAIAKGYLDVVSCLLKHADLLESRYHGKTPLLLAIESKQAAIVKDLLERGADSEAQGLYCGQSAVDIALQEENNFACLACLEGYISLESQQKISPLVRCHLAIQQHRLGDLQSYSECPDDDKYDGLSLLMRAITVGNCVAALWLLNHGAAVDSTESYQDKGLLRHAIENGLAEVASALVAHGADPRQSDPIDNLSPYQFAEANQAKEFLACFTNDSMKSTL